MDLGSSFERAGPSSFGASAAAASPSAPSAVAWGMGASSAGASSRSSANSFGAALNHARNSASESSPLPFELIDAKKSSVERLFVFLACRSMPSTDCLFFSASATIFFLAESRSVATSCRQRFRRRSVRRVAISYFLAISSSLMMAWMSSDRSAAKPPVSPAHCLVTALASASALSIIASESLQAFAISACVSLPTLWYTG
mmetsp:Transcript_11128/g.32860  ORF Transcript_11128/g.32860 Transcript_11128/m.32860 type:complete len:201 (-) Transcript_11128:1418-2020(-)